MDMSMKANRARSRIVPRSNMAAHRFPSLVAAEFRAGVVASCRYAADVDGMGDCCGPSQASTGQDPVTAFSGTRDRRLNVMS
jgi:hypothetical protein